MKNMERTGNRTLAAMALVTALGFCAALAGEPTAAPADGRQPDGPIRVGYFHGGRTALMLRLYAAGGFEKKGLKVDYYAAPLRGKDYALVPRSIEEFNEGGTDNVGKTKGTELTDAMLADRFDLAMIGESSFISAVDAGKPIVAIAGLGHDVKGQGGHVFLMRKGLKTGKPRDYFGKLVVSRRAGPGDAIFLREYLEHAGVNLKTSAVFLKALPKTLEEKRRLPRDKVLVAEDVYEDDMRAGVSNGVIDGGYFHLMGVPKKSHDFDIVASMDEFANPELSHALLVCPRKFLAANRGRLVKLLEAYIERVKYEHGLSYEERTRSQSKGLQMAMDLNGLNYPQYDLAPVVKTDLLYEVKKLLEKHGFVKKKEVKIEDYVDNTLVRDALKNLNLTEKDDVRVSKY
jgi:ABC-type nitrate/sulfonate/bicarbonate transport system substrate-binding protein